LEPGKLKKRLSFQRLSSATNSFGEATQWVTYYTCWGSVQQLRAQLIYGTGEQVGKETYDIRVRHTTTQSINIGDRCQLADGTTFQIDGLMNIQMLNREIQILSHVINETS
jgi:SPP1 family predicted phage head-tail adaptor